MDRTLATRYLAAKRALFDKAYGTLNDMQRQAVFTTEGPLLVLAGAGSGKTTVLVRRIAYIIRYGNAYYTDFVPEGITEERVADMERAKRLSVEEIEQILPEFIHDPCPPYRMLAITFTNKAAGEIKNRLVSQFNDETVAKDIWSGTFHSICMRILRAYGDRVGYGAGFTIYDTDDTKKAISAVMKNLKIDEKQFPPKSVATTISHAKDKLMTAEDFEIEAGSDFRLSRIAAVYRGYEEALRSSNAMDFDDIILQTVRLLRENPDVRAYYQKKFKYVCIDEYQDTNRAQFELSALLSGGSHNLMVVGDDDQSIYKFRGATIENILGFDRVFANATLIKLEQNYRSTKTILDAANGIIGHNLGRKGKSLWTAGETGEKIILRKCEDQMSESRSIVDTIRRMTANGERKFRDFAVLYRTNSQSAGVERALQRSTIPYRVLGGTRFSDRKEIRDAVAYLQLLCNHADRERLLRIINEPRRKIGDKTLAAVAAIAEEQGTTLFHVMDTADRYPALGRSASTLKAFADMIHRLTSLMDTLPLPALFDEVMEQSGYRQMLIDGGEPERERLENIDELKSNMMEYVKTTEEMGDVPSLTGFLEEYALVADVDKYDTEADAVVLMTIHSAKGLEFPIFFLPGMEDGIFPGMQNIMGSSDDMEEERRLAYVAITRAREQVFILHTRSRIWYGQTVANPLSRFVGEIPEELLAREDLTVAAMSAAVGGAAGGASAGGGSRSYYEPPRRQKAPVHTDRLTIGQTAPAVTTEVRKSMNALEPGDRVVHASFGEGEILSIKPMGADKLIEVMFDQVGTKKLMGTYAKLKKLGE
ncbi:MAG: UvrD-helicase domain-containing protein [Clostridia bacterium]|nr:UvrD-helicase domain-containing protein [Clostridia bacterium]